MDVVKKILNKFNGLHYQQEYLCLSKEDFDHSLQLYWVDKDRVINNVTELHLFVGYCPLVFGFSSGVVPSELQSLQLVCSHKSLQPNDPLSQKDALALLSLKKINNVPDGHQGRLFFEGVRGTHHFISDFHQWVIGLSNRLYNKKQGNVYLDNELYKQVQVAYAFPRKISLVTVGRDNLYNHFPTDLHGEIGDRYIISLRHSGKACAQVEEAGKLVLCDLPALAFKKVYALGKNHMQALKESSQFDFSENYSESFHLPLAREAISYKELQLQDSFIHGIHKLLIFQITGRRILESAGTLAHIHNCYATWRYDHRVSSNLLLR